MRLRRRTWFAILVLLAVLAAILAQTGCGEVRPQPTDTEGPAAVLGSVGTTLVWAGAVSAVSGLVLSLVSLSVPAIQPFAIIFRIAGLSGPGISAIGAAYLWVSQHYWWILVVAAVVGVGAAWWYWPRIHRAVDRRIAQN